MNDLSLPDDPNTIIALLALKLDPKLELLPLLGIKKVHMNFRTVTFDVQQNFLKDQVRTIKHHKGFDCDLIIEVLMLWLFVLVEFELKIVSIFLDEFLVGLLFNDFSVLNDNRLDGRWVNVDFLLLFVVLLGFL
jgi:hypothetical protein